MCITFDEYSANPTIKNRNDLVLQNRNLARSVANQIAKKSSMHYKDLEQVGMLALVSAVEKYDPSKGTQFSTFAIPIIRGRILNYIRDTAHAVRIPRSDYDLIQETKRVTKRLVITSGKCPTDSEISKASGVSIRRYREAQKSYVNCRYTKQTDLNLQLIESNTGLFLSQESHTNLSQTLKALLRQLSADDQKAIVAYFSFPMQAISGLDLLKLRKTLKQSLTI